jgi:hypothetical protein
VRYDDRAEIEACVDGACRTRDHYLPALFWRQPWVISGLGEGEHRLVLRRLRGRNLDLDALEVLKAPNPLPAGAHPAHHPEIRYFGEWKEKEVAGRRELRSTDPGATMFFAFRGSGVVLFRTQDSDHGRSELCLDGECREVDSFAQTRVTRSPLAIRGLRPGVHRVILRHLTGRHIHIDGVEVEG